MDLLPFVIVRQYINNTRTRLNEWINNICQLLAWSQPTLIMWFTRVTSAIFVSFQPNDVGFINNVSTVSAKDVSDAIILRVFTGANDAMYDKDEEIRSTLLLNELGLSPKLLCIFRNGLCLEYLVGETIGWEDLSPTDDVTLTKWVPHSNNNIKVWIFLIVAQRKQTKILLHRTWGLERDTWAKGIKKGINVIQKYLRTWYSASHGNSTNKMYVPYGLPRGLNMTFKE
jgi:hypothetical protein